MLVEAGHEVVGTTRSADKLTDLASAGAEPVVMDGLDADSVTWAVTDAKAKRELGWLLSCPSWREGFRSGLR
jgi:uncharacterized protein YbjT (DUF2867 family)